MQNSKPERLGLDAYIEHQSFYPSYAFISDLIVKLQKQEITEDKFLDESQRILYEISVREIVDQFDFVLKKKPSGMCIFDLLETFELITAQHLKSLLDIRSQKGVIPTPVIEKEEKVFQRIIRILEYIVDIFDLTPFTSLFERVIEFQVNFGRSASSLSLLIYQVYRLNNDAKATKEYQIQHTANLKKCELLADSLRAYLEYINMVVQNHSLKFEASWKSLNPDSKEEITRDIVQFVLPNLQPRVSEKNITLSIQDLTNSGDKLLDLTPLEVLQQVTLGMGLQKNPEFYALESENSGSLRILGACFISKFIFAKGASMHAIKPLLFGNALLSGIIPRGSNLIGDLNDFLKHYPESEDDLKKREHREQLRNIYYTFRFTFEILAQALTQDGDLKRSDARAVEENIVAWFSSSEDYEDEVVYFGLLKKLMKLGCHLAENIKEASHGIVEEMGTPSYSGYIYEMIFKMIEEGRAIGIRSAKLTSPQILTSATLLANSLLLKTEERREATAKFAFWILSQNLNTMADSYTPHAYACLKTIRENLHTFLPDLLNIELQITKEILTTKNLQSDPIRYYYLAFSQSGLPLKLLKRSIEDDSDLIAKLIKSENIETLYQHFKDFFDTQSDKLTDENVRAIISVLFEGIFVNLLEIQLVAVKGGKAFMSEEQIEKFLQLAKNCYKSKRDPFHLIQVIVHLMGQDELFRNATHKTDFDYFFLVEILFDYNALSRMGKSIKDLESTVLGAKALREVIIETRMKSKSYEKVENIFTLLDEWISKSVEELRDCFVDRVKNQLKDGSLFGRFSLLNSLFKVAFDWAGYLLQRLNPQDPEECELKETIEDFVIDQIESYIGIPFYANPNNFKNNHSLSKTFSSALLELSSAKQLVFLEKLNGIIFNFFEEFDHVDKNLLAKYVTRHTSPEMISVRLMMDARLAALVNGKSYFQTSNSTIAIQPEAKSHHTDLFRLLNDLEAIRLLDSSKVSKRIQIEALLEGNRAFIDIIDVNFDDYQPNLKEKTKEIIQFCKEFVTDYIKTNVISEKIIPLNEITILFSMCTAISGANARTFRSLSILTEEFLNELNTLTESNQARKEGFSEKLPEVLTLFAASIGFLQSLINALRNTMHYAHSEEDYKHLALTFLKCFGKNSILILLTRAIIQVFRFMNEIENTKDTSLASILGIFIRTSSIYFQMQLVYKLHNTESIQVLISNCHSILLKDPEGVSAVTAFIESRYLLFESILFLQPDLPKLESLGLKLELNLLLDTFTEVLQDIALFLLDDGQSKLLCNAPELEPFRKSFYPGREGAFFSKEFMEVYNKLKDHAFSATFAKFVLFLHKHFSEKYSKVSELVEYSLKEIVSRCHSYLELSKEQKSSTDHASFVFQDFNFIFALQENVSSCRTQEESAKLAIKAIPEPELWVTLLQVANQIIHIKGQSFIELAKHTFELSTKRFNIFLLGSFEPNESVTKFTEKSLEAWGEEIFKVFITLFLDQQAPLSLSKDYQRDANIVRLLDIYPKIFSSLVSNPTFLGHLANSVQTEWRTDDIYFYILARTLKPKISLEDEITLHLLAKAAKGCSLEDLASDFYVNWYILLDAQLFSRVLHTNFDLNSPPELKSHTITSCELRKIILHKKRFKVFKYLKEKLAAEGLGYADQELLPLKVFINNLIELKSQEKYKEMQKLLEMLILLIRQYSPLSLLIANWPINENLQERNLLDVLIEDLIGNVDVAWMIDLLESFGSHYSQQFVIGVSGPGLGFLPNDLYFKTRIHSKLDSLGFSVTGPENFKHAADRFKIAMSALAKTLNPLLASEKNLLDRVNNSLLARLIAVVEASGWQQLEEGNSNNRDVLVNGLKTQLKEYLSFSKGYTGLTLLQSIADLSATDTFGLADDHELGSALKRYAYKNRNVDSLNEDTNNKKEENKVEELEGAESFELTVSNADGFMHNLSAESSIDREWLELLRAIPEATAIAELFDREKIEKGTKLLSSKYQNLLKSWTSSLFQLWRVNKKLPNTEIDYTKLIKLLLTLTTHLKSSLVPFASDYLLLNNLLVQTGEVRAMIRKDAIKEEKQEVTLDRITMGGQAIEALIQSIVYMQRRLSKFLEARVLKIYTDAFESKQLNPQPLAENKQLVSDLNQLASKLDYFDQIAFFLLLDENHLPLLDSKWTSVANLVRTLSKEIFSSDALYDLSTNKKVPTPQEIQKQFHIESMDLFLRQLAEKAQVQNKKLVLNPVSFTSRSIYLTVERNLYELPSREFDSIISNYKLRFVSIEGPQLEAFSFQDNFQFEAVAEKIKGLCASLPGSFEGRLRSNLPQYGVELLNNLLHPLWMIQALEDIDLYVQLLSEICLNPCYEILFFDLIYYLIQLDQKEFYKEHKFNHHYDLNDPILTYQNNLLMVLAKYILRTNTAVIFHTEFGALVTLVEEKILGYQLPIKKKALEALKKTKNDPVGVYFEELLDPMKVLLEGYLSDSSLTLSTRTEVFRMFFSIYIQSSPVQKVVREIFDNSYLYAFLFSPNLFNRFLYEVLIDQLDSVVTFFVEHPQMYQTPLSSLVESEAFNQCKFELEDWVIDFNDYLKVDDKLVFAENISSAFDRFPGAERSFQGQILTFRSIQKYMEAAKQRLGESDEQLKYFDLHQNVLRNILKTSETVTKDDKVRNIFFSTL